MRPSQRIARRGLAVLLCAALLAPPPVGAVELKKHTLEAFEKYVRLREKQIEEEVGHSNPFLWVDALPEARRKLAYEQLRRGEVVIERMNTKVLDNGKEIECKDGLIHHWMGTVFIPGATLQQTIALVQDYDRHHINYTPEVIASKTLERNGNDFKIFMRFKKKKVITVVLNTWQDVRYQPLGETRLQSLARTTRVTEVKHAGEKNERELPPGNDGGFMWHLYTYWLFEERDGGTYVQCEAISISRDIPFLLGWLKQFITSVPKESLMFTLGTTRKLLTQQPNAAPAGR